MNVARLVGLILGKPLTMPQLVQFTAIFTVIDFMVFESGIFQKIPPIPVAWQLLVFIPALFITFAAPCLSLLRFPRKSNALFSYGLSFEQRETCVLYFIKQKSRELLIVISLCYGLELLGEIIFVRSNLNFFSLSIAACGYAEVKAFEWFLGSAVTHGLIRPGAKDKGPRGQGRLGSVQLRRFGIFAIELVSRRLTGFLKNPIRAISRRQLLYFMHGDLFASIAVPLGGVALSALACVMLKDARYQVSDLINVIFPFALLAMNAESAVLSAQKITQCSYYSIMERDFFLSNAIVAAFFCLPFTVIFLATSLTGLTTVRGVFRASDFVSTQLFLIVAAGNWYASMASFSAARIAGVFFWGFPLIALLGIMVPYYGALFPLGILAALFLLGRGDLNRRAVNAF
jgi:hypothetical protein